MPPPPTARLEFRRWRDCDSALAHTLWCDPHVMRFLGGPYSQDEVAERLAREEATEAAYAIQYWPVFVENEFAGCCGLKPFDIEQRFYELGFHFRPERWGGGYASEAARAVIAYAFEGMGAAALFAGHHPENDASRILLGRLGFVQKGTHFFARTGLDHPWYELRP